MFLLLFCLYNDPRKFLSVASIKLRNESELNKAVLQNADI